MDWEDPLEKEMATLSSIFDWEIPWTKEPDGLESMGFYKKKKSVGRDFAAQSLSGARLSDPMNCSTPGFLVLNYD